MIPDVYDSMRFFRWPRNCLRSK